MDEIETLEPIKVLYPPRGLKPKKGFRSLLSEYRNWIERNQDRSYMEILKTDQGKGLNEDTTWEIRQMLGRMTQSVSGPEEDNALRWHLILHLASEIEDHRLEAERILKGLKEKGALLEGSIEKVNDVKNILGDLPQFESEPLLNEKNLRQIFEAWLGLFRGYLKDNELLITLNRRVMDYLSEQWENPPVEGYPMYGSEIRFKIPDISSHTPDKHVELKGYLNNDLSSS